MLSIEEYYSAPVMNMETRKLIKETLKNFK